jgi:hypothetical protein
MVTALMSRKRVTLFERVLPTEGRVDRAAGVIRHVKILGRESSNGRTYSQKAMQDAARLYEGVRVLVNHPKRHEPNVERPIADHFGTLQDVKVQGDGVYGDLHYIRSHPLAEQVCEMAERQPEKIGLSHNAEGESIREYGREVVESVTRVRSVDLVLNPATNRGLFESAGNNSVDARWQEALHRQRKLVESNDRASCNWQEALDRQRS